MLLTSHSFSISSHLINVMQIQLFAIFGTLSF